MDEARWWRLPGAIAATLAAALGTPQVARAADAGPEAVARLLGEGGLRRACPEWKGRAAFRRGLAARRGSGLARAIERGQVAPGLIWCLDEAMYRSPSPETREADRKVLEGGLADLLFGLLARDVVAGRCEGLGALGRLWVASDGWYGEALDEELFQLVAGAPKRFAACWPRFAPFAGRPALGSTDFCYRREEIVALYPGNGGAAQYVRRLARACAGPR